MPHFKARLNQNLIGNTMTETNGTNAAFAPRIWHYTFNSFDQNHLSDETILPSNTGNGAIISSGYIANFGIFNLISSLRKLYDVTNFEMRLTTKLNVVKSGDYGFSTGQPKGSSIVITDPEQSLIPFEDLSSVARENAESEKTPLLLTGKGKAYLEHDKDYRFQLTVTDANLGKETSVTMTGPDLDAEPQNIFKSDAFGLRDTLTPQELENDKTRVEQVDPETDEIDETQASEVANLKNSKSLKVTEQDTSKDALVPSSMSARDNISGNSTAETLHGKPDDDSIIGQGGDDTIFGDSSTQSPWHYAFYNYNFGGYNSQAFNFGPQSSGNSAAPNSSGFINNFNVSQLASDNAKPNDFGVIYTSNLKITSGGMYRFWTKSDDGSVIQIFDQNGTPLDFNNELGGTQNYMNNDRHQGPAERYGDVSLADDTTYTIQIRFWENGGGEELSAHFSGPDTTNTKVSLLNPAGLGIKQDIAAYLAGVTVSTDGNDTIRGGDGNDNVEGNYGDDSISGDAGNDTLDGQDGNDTVLGHEGNDTIWGRSGDDELIGGLGEDRVYGGAGDDTLTGHAGNDILIGGAGNDSIKGDLGNDSIFVGGGDTAKGGSDRDTFTLESDFISEGDTITIDGGSSAGSFGDYDEIELDGMRVISQSSKTIDSDQNSYSGTVVMEDADGDKFTLIYKEIESYVPCLCNGTLVETLQGEKRVEELEIGDKIKTFDHGCQPLRLLARKKLTARDIAINPKLAPVCIKKGAFGPNLPNMDLRVSRQHRFLAISQISQRMFNEIEILIAANKLTTLPDIEIESDPTSLAYFNLLCDSHEIVLQMAFQQRVYIWGPKRLKDCPWI